MHTHTIPLSVLPTESGIFNLVVYIINACCHFNRSCTFSPLLVALSDQIFSSLSFKKTTYFQAKHEFACNA